LFGRILTGNKVSAKKHLGTNSRKQNKGFYLKLLPLVDRLRTLEWENIYNKIKNISQLFPIYISELK
jgi:hypothetical protein